MTGEVNKSYAFSVAISDGSGNILFAKRNANKVRDYKGWWSIPSMNVGRAEYDEALQTGVMPTIAAERFRDRILPGTDLRNVKLLIDGTRQRTDKLLNMAVFSATTSGPVPNSTAKYDLLRFLTPADLLGENGGLCGTCISLYFEALWRIGSLPSTLNYLEIQPEIADSGKCLDQYTPEELWDLAIGNYYLMVRGGNGGDGNVIRSLTLDRFLGAFIAREVGEETKVLDLGCGDGRLLEKLSQKTRFAYGLELTSAENTTRRHEHIRSGNLYDAGKIFEHQCFDLVILNLVLQWIPYLGRAIKAIKSLLAPNGKVLITLITPEFNKNNGQWVIEKGEYGWLIREPLRKERTLVMINRFVGPLWFYPRSTIDYLNSFARELLNYTNGEHIYIDSYQLATELSMTFDSHPYLIRDMIVPPFTALTFTNRQ